jgi:vancomycin resistance protein YoaR
MEKRKFNIRHLTTGVTIFAIVFTIAVLGQTMMILNFNNGDNAQTFTDGVTISRINLSGLNKQQAEYEVSAFLNQKINEMNLNITYEGKEWNFKGSDFQIEDSAAQVIVDAYKYQQKMMGKVQDFESKAIVGNGMNLDIAFSFLFKDINAKLEEIIKQVEKQPKDCQVTFNPANEPKFTYSKSEKGIKVDRIKLFKDLEQQFATNHRDMQIELSTVSIDAKATEDYLKDRTGLVSIFSTSLYNSKESRLHNVALALSKFNGLTIKPGEEISFNHVTSPQTLDGGYKKSIIIFNGQFVEGVGGGLCQASITLYNALILANLEVIEVSKHTLPVGYIELALDAMVSENWSDLRFKNDSEYNIYIAAYVKDARAYVEIYGKTLENGVKLKRRSEFIRIIGHKGDKIVPDEQGEYASEVLYKGEYFRVAYPREGYEAKAYLQFYSGGNLIKEVLIRHEIYEPQQGIVIEGVAEPPKDYIIESEVEIIKPQQTTSDTTGSNVSAVLQKINPVNLNP